MLNHPCGRRLEEAADGISLGSDPTANHAVARHLNGEYSSYMHSPHSVSARLDPPEAYSFVTVRSAAKVLRAVPSVIRLHSRE